MPASKLVRHEMLSIRDAQKLVHQHLGDSSRARHSVFVGYAMRRLAVAWGSDAVLWEVVGLCHDLDYEATANDRTKHGLLAAGWLKAELPPEACIAIAAHDHRTGVASDAPIASALRLSDALALVVDQLGDGAAPVLNSERAVDSLGRSYKDRPYVTNILLENAKRLRIDLAMLAAICTAAPPSS